MCFSANERRDGGGLGWRSGVPVHGGSHKAPYDEPKASLSEASAHRRRLTRQQSARIGSNAFEATMGLFKMLFGSIGGTKDKNRILVVGLDNSGKSTIISYLKPKKVRSSHTAI